MIGGWPIARRAAALVVAPVLNFDPAGVQVAVRAGAGGVLFLGGQRAPAGLAAELRGALATPGPGLAPLFMADEEGGGIQRLQGPVDPLPWPRDMAATRSAPQIEALASTAGRQMLALGVGVDLAPVLDVDGGPGPSATDPDGSRSFSADPAVAGRDGVAFMAGLQQAGVLAVVKHFPGLGGASGNTDYGAVSTRPLAELKAGGLVAFKSALAAGARAVMMSHASVPGLSTLPASLSAPAIGLLRTTLGFQGLVLTDSLSAGAITQAGFDLPHAALTAITAGADLVLFGSTLTPAAAALLSPPVLAASINSIVDALVQAAKSGALPLSRLDDAVEHTMAARHADLCAG